MSYKELLSEWEAFEASDYCGGLSRYRELKAALEAYTPEMIEEERLHEEEERLAHQQWVKEENERRRALNAAYHEKYDVEYHLPDSRMSKMTAAYNGRIGQDVYDSNCNCRKKHSYMIERLECALSVLKLDWKRYKTLSLVEISEMTGYTRQYLALVMGILEENGYVRLEEYGYKRLRKGYK